MSSYVIDFSDPLKNGFAIPAGGFNGPGGSSSNTSLRLYGRGALEWGEAVDEDLVRLAENFASASAPSSAIPGQIWMEMQLYYRNTSVGNVLQGWYYYDLNETAANKWKLLNGTGVVTSTAPLTPVEGQYYYDSGSAQLKGYYSLGRYEPAAWVTRASFSGAGVPVSPTVVPPLRLRVRDAGTAAWITPSATTFSATAPVAPTPGMFWFNTTQGNLNMYTGSAWQEILGPSNGVNTSQASGPLHLSGFKITNLGTPSVGTDAATKQYVDDVAGGVGGFLPLTGGTLSVTGTVGLTIDRTNSTVNSSMCFKTTSGNIFIGQGAANVFAVDDDSSLSGSPWLTATATEFIVPGSIQAGTTISTNGTISTAGAISAGTTLSVGTNATINGTLNMTTHKITNLATGTNANDAVNVSQMNAAIAAGSNGNDVSKIYPGTGSYKAGDIAISAGKVYIAIGAGSAAPPSGNWRQVFPAIYS